MKLTDIECVTIQADPITAKILNRFRAEAIGCDLWAMVAADPICLQVLARWHTQKAEEAESHSQYGSVKWHEERREELKAHWESIERAREGERKRIEATLKDKGYRQENGKIVISGLHGEFGKQKSPIHEKGNR